jgi:hypothetical protein
MRVFITGGTGFIGRHLAAALLARGDQVSVLTRDTAKAEGIAVGAEIISGDPTERGDWMSAVSGCDAAVHLAGAPVDGKRWNARYRQVLSTSRIDSTHNLVDAIAAAERRPAALISASGIDIYPFASELTELRDYFEDTWVTESAPKSDSFFGRLCREWEREARGAEQHGCRVACMRTGLVLGARDGALSRMITPFKLFVGGKIGSGQQWVSWIHLDDAVRGYLHALDTELSGPVNLVAPEPVRNKELAKALGRVLSRPSLIPVPAFAVKLAVGELAEYLLGGRRAQPKCLLDSGFEFNYPALEPALEELLS